MTTLFGQEVPEKSEKHSIIDDFSYGSNVASSAVYIRMGKTTINCVVLTSKLLTNESLIYINLTYNLTFMCH